jgi:hypothetical protein
MNLAFPALLIFILVLPGVIYRYSYARGPWGWASPVSIRTISDELAYSVMVAVGLHAVWTTLASCLGYEVDYLALLAFLTGNFGKDSQLFGSSVLAFSDHKVAVAAYFVSLAAAAGGIGVGAHAAVRKLGLDLRTSWFRFENTWHYLLTGELLGFDVAIASVDLPDGVYVSAVVEQGKECHLYWGFLSDFTFDTAGSLERLLLRGAHHRPCLGIECLPTMSPIDNWMIAFTRSEAISWFLPTKTSRRSISITSGLKRFRRRTSRSQYLRLN